MVKGTNALIVAGGGGGGDRSTNASLVDASINTSGNNERDSFGNAGGTNGNGGSAAGQWGGAGGAGFLENGQNGSTNSRLRLLGEEKLGQWNVGWCLDHDSSGHGSNGGFGGGGASSGHPEVEVVIPVVQANILRSLRRRRSGGGLVPTTPELTNITKPV